MSKQLIQKRKFTKKIFKLKKDEIKVYESDLSEDREYSVDYLQLGVKTFRNNARDINWQLVMFSVFLSQFGMLIYAIRVEWTLLYLLAFSIIGAIALGLFIESKMGSKKRTILLSGGKVDLEFFQNKPTPLEAEDFIDETISRIKKAYRAEYLKWEKSDTIEYKKERIEWLKKMRIISEEEMNELIHDVETKTFKPIGFMKNRSSH